MKKSDIAMIILIASIAMFTAFAIASNIPALKISSKGVQVDTIEEISDSIVEPSPEIFNSDAINPTVETVIGTAASEQ